MSQPIFPRKNCVCVRDCQNPYAIGEKRQGKRAYVQLRKQFEGEKERKNNSHAETCERKKEFPRKGKKQSQR
jgi:hypothetical protein